MAKKFNEKDKIAIVFEKAPKEYSNVPANTESKHGNKLTMKDMEDAMKLQFGIYDGICCRCRRKGHMTNKCTKKKNGGNGTGKFRGSCQNCSNKDHKEMECWTKEFNTSKHPNWYQKSREKGLSETVESGNIEKEYLLLAHDTCREIMGYGIELDSSMSNKSIDEENTFSLSSYLKHAVETLDEQDIIRSTKS
eukprot:8166295-Ditylum_brightwellii.AAC.1